MIRRINSARPLFVASALLVAVPAWAQSHNVHVPTPAPHAEHVEHASTHAAHVPKTPTLTVAQRIDANPNLVARLQPLLPSGMTIDQAAQGFKNQGQFIAALHVSHNLNIPFDKLKAEMTGTEHDSLGQAIHDLKPTVDAKAAAKQAETEAKTDRTSTRVTSDTTKAPKTTDNDADDVK